jgi:hypothetical protein
MKRVIKYSALAGIFASMAIIAAAVWHTQESQSELDTQQTQQRQAPAKMLAMGPVGTDISSVEQVGNVSIKMTAARFYFKKSKTLGFDNGLFKKLAAKDFCLTISKAGNDIFSARKDLVEMPLDRGVITIRKPDILFPTDMEQPDSIKLDKSNMLLFIRHGSSQKTWDLSKS